MKLSQGVEWGMHCMMLIAQAPDDTALARRTLAEHYALPETYLAKHLQALTRAGLLAATPGPRGGFRLARPPGRITALEVFEAIEGSGSPFRCQEIRQRGTGAVPPEQCTRRCAVDRMMAGAYAAWRDSLRHTTIADLVEQVPAGVRARDQRSSSGTDQDTSNT